MAVEALKNKLALASSETESASETGEELKPNPDEVLKQRAAELLHSELHELGMFVHAYMMHLYIFIAPQVHSNCTRN